MSLNRLKLMSCYLAGPIQACVDEGRAWRKDITPFLENLGVRVFNPLEPIFENTSNLDEVMRPEMAKLIEEEKWEELREIVKKIVRSDLHMVDMSSFIIVNYDVNVHMCGTYEEIFVANKAMKPVLMVVKDKKKLPLWMYGRIPTRSHMFEGWDKLKEYLSKVNSDENFKFDVADQKRWMFFNQK